MSSPPFIRSTMRPSQVNGTNSTVHVVSYLDELSDEDVLNAVEKLRLVKGLRKCTVPYEQVQAQQPLAHPHSKQNNMDRQPSDQKQQQEGALIKTPSSNSQRTASTKSSSSLIDGGGGEDEDEVVVAMKKGAPDLDGAFPPGFSDKDGDEQQRNKGNSNGKGVWDQVEKVGAAFLQKFSCQPVTAKMKETSSKMLSIPAVQFPKKEELLQQKDRLVQRLKVQFDQILVNAAADGTEETVALDDAEMAETVFDDNATATSLYLAKKELREAIAQARRTEGPLTSQERMDVLKLRLKVLSKNVMDGFDKYLLGIDDDIDHDDDDDDDRRVFLLNEDDATFLTRSLVDPSFDEETLETYDTKESKETYVTQSLRQDLDDRVDVEGCTLNQPASVIEEGKTPPRRGAGTSSTMTTETDTTTTTCMTTPLTPPQLIRKSVTAKELFVSDSQPTPGPAVQGSFDDPQLTFAETPPRNARITEAVPSFDDPDLRTVATASWDSEISDSELTRVKGQPSASTDLDCLATKGTFGNPLGPNHCTTGSSTRLIDSSIGDDRRTDRKISRRDPGLGGNDADRSQCSHASKDGKDDDDRMNSERSRSRRIVILSSDINEAIPEALFEQSKET